MQKTDINIAAVGDLHCGRASDAVVHSLLEKIAEQADIVLLCGDLTDTGTIEEAQVLAKDIQRSLRMPVVAVFGNHDVEGGKQKEISDILGDAGVCVLDGSVYEFHGISFVGVKGFGGGFGARMLEPWGEAAIKVYVREAVDEALKLESALARAESETKIVLLHYSPIAKTVEGESLETYPFLGSSRLEEPLNRYQVKIAFHGHAHIGSPQGITREGVQVYNVSRFVLRKYLSEELPVRFVQVPVQPSNSFDGGRRCGSQAVAENKR